MPIPFCLSVATMMHSVPEALEIGDMLIFCAGLPEAGTPRVQDGSRNKKARRTRLFHIKQETKWRKKLRVVAKDSNSHINHDIGMQSNRNHMIANDLQWAVRQTDLSLFNWKALFCQRFSNIKVGHGTEQATIDTGFLRNPDSQATQLFALRLRCRQLFCSCLCQLGALRFKFSDSARRGATRHASRDQEVTRITVLDTDDFAQATEIDDFIQ